MAIFVIGMHRSGTSMVASILQALGVNLGPDDEMVPANRFNEAGYFENASAVALNEGFLTRNDLSWRTLPAIDLRKSLTGVEEYTQALGQITTRLGESSPWGLKDPRLSFLLPYWKDAAKPVSAIICLRRPQAAALSLNSRNDLSVSYAAALWELYTLAALRNTRRMTRAVVVYEELLAHPKKTIETLVEALPELSGLKPSPSAIKDAVARVRRDLDHSRPVNGKILPPAVSELYERIAAGDLGIRKDDLAHGVSLEMVRLEAGHQSAKRMNGEAREQLAQTSNELRAARTSIGRHTERLGDVVGLILEPGEATVTEPDHMLQRLRQAARQVPTAAQKQQSDLTLRELLRAKDERIEWLRLELGATGSRLQLVLDEAAKGELEIGRLRGELHNHEARHEQGQREIARLAQGARQASEALTKSERSRSELEAQLAQLETKRATERDQLSARVTELKSEIARVIREREQSQELARERDAIIQDLKRQVAASESYRASSQASEERANALERQLADMMRELKLVAAQNAATQQEAEAAIHAGAKARSVLETTFAKVKQEKQQIESELAAARLETEGLRQQLVRAHGALEKERLLDAEHAEMKRALGAARAQVEALKADLAAKAKNAAAKPASPATDKRLRQQLLVLVELLQVIDRLLSPRFGRFTIPVRQIRVQLSQARQVLDSEVALTRRP